MPVAIRIERKTGTAIASCSGVLRVDDARDSAAELWKTAGWNGKAVIWDFRQAQFDVSSTDTQRIASFILEHQPTPPPSKVAFVTPSDVEFGMARMFEAFREDAPTAFRVFRDYEEALSWARSPGTPLA